MNPALTTTQAVPSTTLTAGSAATPFTPVTASGGTGTLSFALSGGTLPTGLNFSTSTGQITGTPTAALALTTFTVTVTDQTTPTPQTSSKTFSLTVVVPALVTTQAVPSTTLTVGSAATPFTPVTASGGTGTLSFALSGGTLPTGLTFSTSTGQITGTPTAALALTTFTVTVTDQTTPAPQTSSKTFNLTVVIPALTTTQAVPSTTLTVGSAATPFTPVTASGGTGTLSFALSGATLPTGLNFSTSTGQITGTPTAALAPTTFTVTVTDQTTPTPQTSVQDFQPDGRDFGADDDAGGAEHDTDGGQRGNAVYAGDGFGRRRHAQLCAFGRGAANGFELLDTDRSDHRHTDNHIGADDLHGNRDGSDHADGANLIKDFQSPRDSPIGGCGLLQRQHDRRCICHR